jgi:hypothetical protein
MRRAAVLLLLLCASSPVLADFRQTVRAVEKATGARQTYIPFFGLARLVINVIEPEGISDIRLAVFDGRRFRLPSHFPEMLRAAVGPRWQPVVTTYSRRSGEQAFIFVRESRRGMRMLIVAMNRNEGGAVVELELDPRRLAHFVEHAGSGRPVFHW